MFFSPKYPKELRCPPFSIKNMEEMPLYPQEFPKICNWTHYLYTNKKRYKGTIAHTKRKACMYVGVHRQFYFCRRTARHSLLFPFRRPDWLFTSSQPRKDTRAPLSPNRDNILVHESLPVAISANVPTNRPMKRECSLFRVLGGFFCALICNNQGDICELLSLYPKHGFILSFTVCNFLFLSRFK